MIAPYGILFDSSRVDCVRACVRPKRIAGGVDERDTRMRNYQEMHACALCNRRMRAGRTCPRWYFLSLYHSVPLPASLPLSPGVYAQPSTSYELFRRLVWLSAYALTRET